MLAFLLICRVFSHNKNLYKKRVFYKIVLLFIKKGKKNETVRSWTHLEWCASLHTAQYNVVCSLDKAVPG
jgi:hypothetical protein